MAQTVRLQVRRLRATNRRESRTLGPAAPHRAAAAPGYSRRARQCRLAPRGLVGVHSCPFAVEQHRHANAMKKINSNELAEETWFSPKGKFGGAGKEISEALGRKPQSTDLMERHPF